MSNFNEFARESIRRDWNIEDILRYLEESGWRETEPNVFERHARLTTYDSLKRYAFETYLEFVLSELEESEWERALKEGFDHRTVEDYVRALEEVLSKEAESDIYTARHPFSPEDVIVVERRYGYA